MENKRIAYITFQVTKEGQAAHAHVHEIVAGLRENGWVVTILEPRQSKSAVGRIIPFLLLQLRAITSLHRYSVLYIRGHFAALPICIAARVFRKKYIIEVNGPYEDMFIAWPMLRAVGEPLRWSMYTSIRLASAIITVTEGLRNWIAEQLPGNSIYVIPNAANTQLFTPSVAKDEYPKPYVAFAGSLARWQGIDVMLDALAEDLWPTAVSIVIAGDGDLAELVVGAASKDSRIRYLGKIPYQKVPSLLAGSIAGLVCKNNLGDRVSTGLSPLKLYEIMACGVPAIVTDFPGQSELVTEGRCGLVIPPEDSRALAQAVRSLVLDPEASAQMGYFGRKLAVEYHSWRARAGQTSLVLETVLGRDASNY